MSEFPASSEDSTSTSDPPTPPPRRQKASTSTGKHKGARTHKVKEGEGKGKGKKRREPSPSRASSGSDSNSPDHHHKSSKECAKKQKIHSKETKSSRKTEPPSQNERSHLDIFQCHYSNLVSSITPCLNTVANKLYSRKMISDEILSGVFDSHETRQSSASKVLLCVKRRVDSDPAVLFEFIDILKEEPSCDEIAKKITSE